MCCTPQLCQKKIKKLTSACSAAHSSPWRNRLFADIHNLIHHIVSDVLGSGDQANRTVFLLVNTDKSGPVAARILCIHFRLTVI